VRHSFQLSFTNMPDSDQDGEYVGGLVGVFEELVVC